MNNYYNPTKAFGPDHVRAGPRLARPSLKPEHAFKGAIAWLPSNASGTKVLGKCKFVNCHEMGHEIGDGGYDHPVLIIDSKESSKTGGVVCTIVKMTSFRGCSIEEWQERRKGNTRMCQAIPIEHIERPGLSQLKLKGANRLGRQTWILCDHVYDAHISVLEYYKSATLPDSVPELTPESLEKVRERLNRLSRRVSPQAAAQLVAQQPPRQRVASTPSPRGSRNQNFSFSQRQSSGHRRGSGSPSDMAPLSAGRTNEPQTLMYHRAPTSQDPIPYKPLLSDTRSKLSKDENKTTLA